jgi:hypothetical protein
LLDSRFHNALSCRAPNLGEQYRISHRRGKVMIPAICEAIEHAEMKARRYAICALGHIKANDASGLAAVEVRRKYGYIRALSK